MDAPEDIFDDLRSEFNPDRDERREDGWTDEELANQIAESDYFEAGDEDEITLTNYSDAVKVSLTHEPTELTVTNPLLETALRSLGKAVALTNDVEKHTLPTGTVACPECERECRIQHHDYEGLSVYCRNCGVKSTASGSPLVTKEPSEDAIQTLPDVSWTYDCGACDREHHFIEPFEGEFFTEDDFDHDIQNGAYAETPGTVNCPCGHQWEFDGFDWSNDGENECPRCGRVYSFSVSPPTHSDDDC